MASLPDLTTIIRAVDEATGPLRQVVGSLRGVGEAAHHASAEVAHVEHAGMFAAMREHVAGVRERFGELRASIGETFAGLSEFVPALGVLGGVSSAVGLVELTEHVAEVRSELNATAIRLGVTTQQLVQFNEAAKLTDVPVEAAQNGINRLNRAIGDSAAGKNKQAMALFSHLHISLRDANGHLRTAAQLFPQLADAFRNTADPAMRTRMAMVLMGRSGTQLIPMLMEGSAGLREFAEQSKAVNFTPDPEQAEGLERFHRAWILLKDAVQGLADEIGTALAPVLTPIVDRLREWITANRDWIATDISAKVKALADAFAGFDLSHPIASLGEVIGRLTDAHAGFGKLIAIVGGFALLAAAPFVASAAEVAIGISGIAVAAIGPIISSLATLGASVIGFGSVMDGLKYTLMENPLGLVITAAALAGVAAYELYEHWDQVKALLQAAWRAISSAASETWSKVTADLTPFVHDLPAEITSAWEGIKSFFTGLWADVTGIFNRAMADIQPIVDKIAAMANFVMHPFGGGGGNGPALPGAPGGQMPAMPTPMMTPDGIPMPSFPMAPAPMAPAPGLPLGAPGAATAAPAKDGNVHVSVDFKNTPPGTTVNATGSGAAASPSVDVGYNAMLGMGF